MTAKKSYEGGVVTVSERNNVGNTRAKKTGGASVVKGSLTKKSAGSRMRSLRWGRSLPAPVPLREFGGKKSAHSTSLQCKCPGVFGKKG